MKIRKPILAIVLIFAILLGCSPSPPQIDTTNTVSLHTQIAYNYELTHVEAAMDVKGITFVRQAPRQDWVLEGVHPVSYHVSSTGGSKKDSILEEASVYIFPTEQGRSDGLADFHEQTKAYDMLYPRIYEKRNVLIFYWALADQFETAKLEEKFKNTWSTLHVQTELEQVSTGSKELPYQILIVADKRYGSIAFDEGAAISSIDTHRSGRMHSIQLRGWHIPFSVEIRYSGDKVLVDYVESDSSRVENVILQFRDDDLEPYNIDIALNGKKQRIAGVEHGME